MRRILVAAIAAAASVLSAHAHAETRVTVTTGFDVSSGDYGQPMDTEVVAVPFTVRFTNEEWSARASISHLEITGPAGVVSSDEEGGEGDGGATGGNVGAPIMRAGTETGFGDLSLSVTRSFRRLGGSRAYFDATARVRLPTGDEEKGLGVGATDYSLGGELGVSAREGGSYVAVTRRFLGDHAHLQRRDGWQVNLGAWRHISRKATVGTSFYWRQASLEHLQNPAEIGVNASYRLTRTVRVSAHVSAGITDASPNLSSGMRISWRSPAPRRD
ncbi:hypothetical protein U91I_01944 [alpha proteobacterium U9-1i]|nr:hypothetical protein U91I_01944 [alpha proteobacterium U9-1i]